MGTSNGPMMGYASVAHRVLSIPELLELVFEHLDNASNASNACVCKTWGQVALDTLWREIDNPRRLFSLLAPMERSGSKYNFTRATTPRDWHRFSSYARRVRRFTYNDRDADATISVSAFEEISQTRTTLSVLPNLREFSWTTIHSKHRRFFVLFMSESLRSLTFDVAYDEMFPRQPFFQDIVDRTPYLTYLDIRTKELARDIEPEFLELIRGLRKLRKVVVPLYHITSKVMEALSTLEDLGTIQFEFYKQGTGSKEDLEVFNPTLTEDGFSSLWDLSLSVHLNHCTTFLKGPHAPAHLTSIYIHAMSVENEASVHHFFAAIAEQCPLVQALYLECLPGPILSTQWNATMVEFEPLTLNTFKPLFDCFRLIKFELMHPVPLNLTMNDLEELSIKWSTLEVIILNCEPVLAVDVRSNLNLHALLPFARNCRNLIRLGLFINATAADIPPPTEIPEPFPQLAELRFGVSAISETDSVALFLSRVCSVGCFVATGVTWPYLEVESPVTLESAKVIATWCSRWEKVDSFLPLLTKLRMEEREVRRLIEEEAEDLRTRNRILMDKAQLALSGDGDESCVIV